MKYYTILLDKNRGILKMSTILNKEKGMTLIELLSALVILSIVLIGFFSVFVQSANMQTSNEDHLVATNLARKALEDVRQINKPNFDIGHYTHFNKENSPSISSVNEKGQFISHPSFYLQLQFKHEPQTSLWLTKIIIQNKKGKPLAETYDYIKVGSE